MLRLMATKIGMTTVFDADGSAVPVTVLRFEKNRVLEVKDLTAGARTLVVGAGVARAKHVSKPVAGHFKKLGVEPVLHLKSSQEPKASDAAVGAELDETYFEGVNFVDVQATTIGKGFQGVMKRYGYAGGPGGHGSNFHRRLGSAGSNTYPAKVWKGKGMPGRMGGVTRTLLNLKVVSVDKENHLLLVRGSVPGHNRALVYVRKAVKKA